MRILYYSPHPLLRSSGNTGYGTHIRESILGFREHGHNVETLIMGDVPGNSGTIKNKYSFLKTIAKLILPGYVWRTIKDYAILKFDNQAGKLLDKKIEKFKPDIVYERSAFLQSSGYKICSKKSIKYFIEINAPFTEEAFSFAGGRSFFSASYSGEKKQIEFAEKVFVVSSALKTYLLKKYFLSDEAKIIVVPNAVNLQNIVIDYSWKKKLKEQYSIQDDSIVIGFVGSIFPYHGVDLLIKAFSEVLKSNSNKIIKLLIVGDGYILEDLKLLAKKMSISDQVIFTNSVDHNLVFTYIDIMDIAVMAKSNWYGSPVKIFEYGALGKAIIAPDTIPLRDVMQNEVEGLLVLPQVEKISQAIHRLIQDISLRKKIGENFKINIMKNHTWSKITEKILINIEEKR